MNALAVISCIAALAICYIILYSMMVIAKRSDEREYTDYKVVIPENERRFPREHDRIALELDVLMTKNGMKKK